MANKLLVHDTSFLILLEVPAHKLKRLATWGMSYNANDTNNINEEWNLP